MSCAVLYGASGAFSFDRMVAGGYPVWSAGPSRVADDLGELDYPLYDASNAPASFSPAQTAYDSSWRPNKFSSVDTSANTVVYKLRFLDAGDVNESIRLASQQFWGDRQDYGETFYVGAAAVSEPPAGPIASFSMVAANFGGGTSGVTGAVGSNAKGGITIYRQELDAKNLPSYEHYHWVMLYEPDSRGGWGDLPTPEMPSPASDPCYLVALRDYYADLKASIPNVKVGLYVNGWAAWENSVVYTQHPSWFRSRSMANDGGGTAYFGKLPEWGQHLYDPLFTPAEPSVPEMIEAYDLDFVFFDNGGFADAFSGDVSQMRTFFTNLINAVHDAGAISISNGINPYMDMNYLERVAGLTAQNDMWFVDSYNEMYTHPRAVAPLTFRLGGDEDYAPQAFINNGWTDDPGFVPYFPVHFLPYANVNDAYTQWVDILRSRHLPTDMDGDYYVDLRDFAVLAASWMECNNPDDPACIQWP